MNQAASQHSVDPQAIRAAVSRGRGRVEKAFTPDEVRKEAERLYIELGNCLHGKPKVVK